MSNEQKQLVEQIIEASEWRGKDAPTPADMMTVSALAKKLLESSKEPE